jgi:serine/threonine-protein kinase
MRVPAAGGKPEQVFKLAEGELTQRWPQVLPGGKAILYSSAASLTEWESANLVVQPLEGGARKVVVRGGYYGRYLPSGHLAYVHEGTMFAAPFDPVALDVTGSPVPVVEGVASSPGVTGGAQFAVGGNGALVYIPGQAVSAEGPMVWMDRSGKTSPLRAMPANWSNPVFSPDGSRLAVDIWDGKQADVWIYDWARDTLSRLTFDQTDDQRPAWTPDGQRIVFSSKRGDGAHFNLYWQRADGTGDAMRLTDSTKNQYAGSWHPAGKVLAFLDDDASDTNIMLLPMEGDETTGWKPGAPTAFLTTPLRESTPIFSPDGRWIAYLSNENGRNDLFVRPFPGPGGKWQISTAAADDPMWSRTSREVFFAAPDLQLMVAAYSVDGDSFRADKPKVVSETRFTTRPRPPSRDIAIHPDGQRFAIAPLPESQTTARLDKVVFVLNFFDELRRIAAPRN